MSPEVDIVKRLLSHDGMSKELLRNESIRRTEHFTSSHIDVNDVDLMLAQEPSTINTGSLMIRRTRSARRTLDM